MSVLPLNEEQIYRDYHGKVRAYVRGKISDGWEAEDLVSEVFIKVCKKLPTFDATKSSVSTWIYTITRNTVIDYFRTKKQVYELPLQVECDDEALQNVLNEESIEELADALQRLDERSRDLIVLHYYKEYTLKKTGEIMHMSYANTKIVHQKALKKLALYLRIS